jgi:hypothetical protein
MPQETNLNVSPYFDDFDPKNEYYKVLFKPGYPVQARELTTIQSILQNQIERFGNHIFKEGSMVVPGNIIYKNNLNAVILEDTFRGIPSDYYSLNLLGVRIKGQNSSVIAEIQDFISAGTNGVSKNTLYVKYITSSLSDNNQKTFIDGETLLFDQDVTVVDPETIDDEEPSEIVLRQGEGFAATVAQNSTAIGSAVFLDEGIYFIRGFFVSVPTSILYLDPYSNIPSYKVGFRVLESIKNAFDDPNLYDNAQGFSNFAAPGADRFSISVKIDKIPLESNETDNFVQLMEVNAGQLINITDRPEYNILAQEIARRTFDESGDYYVVPPIINAQDSLNNLRGNNGIFSENQLTYDGNIPSEDLGTYNISPLKAYVRGFEIETLSPTFLDFPKTRTSKTLENQSVNYYTGPTFTLNRVYGVPTVSTATTYYVSLRDSRVGSSSTIAAGNEIGLARVYDFALESGSYNTSNLNQNQWDISLYDVQTYTTITLNEPITLVTPTHIRGKESGAVGFLRSNVSSGIALTAYCTSGKFSLGEKLIFDGIENTRVTKTVRSYGVGDVKSIFGQVGTSYTFSGDVIQRDLVNIGQVTISARSTSGISTVTSSRGNFIGIASVGNLVAFSNPGFSTNTFAKIESVSTSSLTISGVTTVIGICDGGLPQSTISISDFRILNSPLQNSIDNSLYTILPKSYISSVDLTNSNLTIRKQYDVTISSNSTGIINADADQTFLPFDEERYIIIRQNGTVEALRSDMFEFSNGGRSLTVSGLSGNGNAKLIATLRKSNVKAKIKNRNRIKILTLDKSRYSSSGIGSTTLNDGLTYGNYPYGTRVQDEEICLLEPDVTSVYGVYESNNIFDADLPSIVLTSLNGPTGKTTDLLLGEEVVGEDSQAVAILADKINDLKVGFSYLNSNTFIEGERVRFSQSGITGLISLYDIGDRDISQSYSFDANQRETIYDFSKLIRSQNVKEPTRKLKIVYESASFSSSDTGDITTVNSYDQFSYSLIKNSYDTLRNSDILDIRPRVSPITPSEGSRSPFEFLSRNFTTSGNSAPNILASDESILLSYSFYLPRIDKILLDKEGNFQLKTGSPAETPQQPVVNEDALEIATAYLPPYITSINEIDIDLKEHKRYRMLDINKLEDRIENLEYYTSLSLLEVNASNFPVTDSNGVNRFKSGFFVDNFSSRDSQDKNVFSKNSIDTASLELRPPHFTTSIDLLLDTSIAGITTQGTDLRTLETINGQGVRKTGQLITLDYVEQVFIEQPYATRAVNVNPYAEDFYGGTIFLFPSSDVWLDQVRSTANTLLIDREEIELEELLTYDPQKGFSTGTWDAVTKTWLIPEKRTSFGDRVLDTKIIPFMRSRNVEFIAKRLRPYTRVYSFFGGIDVNRFVVPKLIEISMISGVFEVGENVIGTFDSATANSPTITFRVANQNHKYGTYNNPSDFYIANPYSPTTIIPEVYSSTSTILNVDTYSLANQPQGQFSGYIAVGMKLRGQTSKAEATVTNLRLVTNEQGAVLGSFFIPNPNIDINPKFECGTKIFRLTSSATNSLIFGTYTTSAEEKYVAEGKINTVQENLIVSRPIRIEIPLDDPVVSPGPQPQPQPQPQPGPSGGGGAPAPTPTPTRTATPTAPTAPTPTRPAPTAPAVVPTAPPPVSVTNLYYNRGSAPLYSPGANRLESLLKEAGLKEQAKKVDKDMPSAQQTKFVDKFNKSEYAIENNYKLNTNNAKKSDVITTAQPGEAKKVEAKALVANQNTKIGPGDKDPKGGNGSQGKQNDPPKSSNSNNNNSSGNQNKSGGGSDNKSSGNKSNDSGPKNSPSPSPSMSSSPAKSPSPPPAPAPAPKPAPAPSPMSSGNGSGGMGMSDINLKDNIQPIDNALNRLFQINLNYGIVS